MKTIFEYLLVSVIAILMAWLGYWLMGKYDQRTLHWGNFEWEWRSIFWWIWSSAVSVMTWVYLYRIGRDLHWLVLPALGICSPIIGALLFVIPYFLFPFIILWGYAPVIFPVGLVTGLIISVTTLPFRPKGVLRGNVGPDLFS